MSFGIPPRRIEANVKYGKLTELKLTPESRRKDIVIPVDFKD